MSTALPTYPSDFENEPLLLSTLGSFWSDQFVDKDAVLGMLCAAGLNQAQTVVDLNQASDTLARATIPVFRKILWLPLSLREDQMNNSPASVPRFGDGYVFGDSAIQFGRPYARAGTYVFPLPNPAIRSIAAIYNRIADPTSVQISGVDFIVDASRQALILNRNPFTDITAAVRTVGSFPDGSPIRECQLWAYSTTVDTEDIWNHLGYVLKAHSPSSEAYRDLCNALMDAHVGGPTEMTFRKAFAAAAGHKVVPGTETVEAVIPGLQLQVVTDRAVYTFPNSCTPAVLAGDEVGEGDTLVNELAFIDCNASGPKASAISGLAGITLGKKFFGDA